MIGILDTFPVQLAFWCTGRFSLPDDAMWLSVCHDCGHTGDLWDDDLNDWATPWQNCRCCDGAGEH